MTDQTRFESKLAEVERKYRLLSENLIDAVWVLDIKSMRYLYVSPSVESLRGYRAEELQGQIITDHLAPDSMETVRGILREELMAYRQGIRRKRTMEIQMKHRDGHFIWVEIIARLFEQDREIRVIGVTRDIDHRKKLEREREGLIKELENALKEVTRLLKENKVLRGLLPICSYCKRIRDQEGQWHHLETYIQEHSEAEFTHTICPPCIKKHFPGLKQGQ